MGVFASDNFNIAEASIRFDNKSNNYSSFNIFIKGFFWIQKMVYEEFNTSFFSSRKLWIFFNHNKDFILIIICLICVSRVMWFLA